MENQLSKRYGLITAITMVVGIVIGSGIFFKTESVLTITQGNAGIGILALIIMGAVMLICSYTFSILATRYERVNGIVDYAEVLVGKRYAYYVGWFLATMYYPTLTSVLAWLSARYTCVLFGIPDPVTGGGCLAIASFYLIVIFTLNALAPILAGKFQVSSTVIKLVPLILMAVAGMVRGISSGTLAANFTSAAVTKAAEGNARLLLTSCVAMAFSYEGWIITTAINAELKNAKRNLPIALVVGAIIVVSVYVLYYLGINGSITTAEILESGSTQAFINLFGTVGGTILMAFIVVSCLGTCNGLMLGCVRGIYSLAARNEGPKPDVFIQVDKYTNMPANSCIIGLLFCGAWLLYFFGGTMSGWFGVFNFDSSELPIITLYGGYIPIFIMMMKKERDLGAFKRFVMPVLSILACIFMVYAAIVGHSSSVIYYLIVFAVIMAAGAFFGRSS